MAISLSGFEFFMPVAAFLLVFVLVYALLLKTKILGDNQGVNVTISLLLAVFFIVNAKLAEFVTFSSAWFVVFLVCMFLILLLIAFTHGKIDAVMKPAVAWVLLGLLVIFFIVSASYVFNFAFNWDNLWDWAQTDWFGFVVVLGVAGIVAWALANK